jgi:hypothetical protein
MKYDIETVLEDSVARLTTQAAAVLVAAYTLVSVLQAAAVQDLFRVALEWFLDQMESPDFQAEFSAEQAIELERAVETAKSELPLALGLSPGAAVALWIVSYLIGLVVLVVALDTFGRKQDRLTGLETTNIGWKVLNFFVGSIVFVILVAIGLVLFVIPGLILMVLLVFFPAAIAIDNKSFVSAFGASYNVAKENLLATVVLMVVNIIVFMALGFVSGIITGVIPGAPGAIVNQAITAVGWAFGLALTARAYVDATRGATPRGTGRRTRR